MNKRFSTLLAAALVAGSFSSAFAQLEGRNVEWKDAQASRAYYLAGVHFVSPTDYCFNDTATTEIYTLSLHDALPIY